MLPNKTCVVQRHFLHVVLHVSRDNVRSTAREESAAVLVRCGRRSELSASVGRGRAGRRRQGGRWDPAAAAGEAAGPRGACAGETRLRPAVLRAVRASAARAPRGTRRRRPPWLPSLLLLLTPAVSAPGRLPAATCLKSAVTAGGSSGPSRSRQRQGPLVTDAMWLVLTYRYFPNLTTCD